MCVCLCVVYVLCVHVLCVCYVCYVCIFVCALDPFSHIIKPFPSFTNFQECSYYLELDHTYSLLYYCPLLWIGNKHVYQE